MSQPLRTLAALLLALSTAPPLAAQPPSDLSGRWEGSIQAPAMEIPFVLDLVKNAGEYVGTVNLPLDRVTGLPLLKITVDGTTVAFYARADQPLNGTVSSDGTTVTGNYFAEGGSVPFTMKRTGAAQMPAAPVSAPIPSDLEGTWTGVIAANGLDVHVEVTLANGRDGTSSGRLVNLDQGGLQLPLAIAREGTRVTLTSPAAAISFAGTLNADAGELTGAFTQGAASVPATLRRRR